MSFDDLEDDGREEAAHERRIQRCRSCNAKIIWFKTAAGKNMPVDEGTVEAGEYELDLKKHRSHFSTCPMAVQHRRPR
ncbi:MAG TPA: hypothetical protein VGG49_02350 [Steroidobacteraceae bacterium]|jgi:hypothetical protein